LISKFVLFCKFSVSGYSATFVRKFVQVNNYICYIDLMIYVR